MTAMLMPLRVALGILLVLIPFFTNAQTTVISHDFNSSADGWSSSSGWTRTNSSFSGNSTNHWHTTPFSNYSSNMNVLVTSGAMDFTGRKNLFVQFSLRYDTEADWDGLEVEYSLDNSVWNNLGAVGEGTNWYNDTDVDAIANDADGWSGDNSSWTTSSIQLPSAVENDASVYIRFRFESDGFIEDVGVAFDDFQVLSYSTPGDVGSSTVLWLKGDVGVTGSPNVSAWADQSGNGNNAAQGTGSRQPTLVSEAFNFNPAMTFDGTDDFLDVTYNAQLNGDNMTVFSVHRVEQDDNSWRSPFTSRDDYPQRGYIVYVRSDNDQYDLWTGANGIGGRTWDSFQQGLTPGADLQVLGVSFTASSVGSGAKNFYMDGNLQGSTSSEYYVVNTAQPYRVGAGSSETPAGQYFWYGDIAEQVVFSKILSAAERQRVTSYLAVKYGITLTHDYFTATYDGTNAASTTLYDVSNGYGHDIAGIGKEDIQSLNQSKSKSENDDAVITVTAPTSLDDGDYLLWGNNNLTGTRTTDLPLGYDERLEKIWFFDEMNDVGTITMRFDLSKLGNRSTDPNDYAILINHSAAVFASAVTVTSGASISSSVLTFTNVPIQDGDYLTLAVSAVRGPGAVSSGMKAWMKASLVTLDGSTVDLWPDQSGNGNNLEPVPFNRPVLEGSLKVNNNSYINYTSDNGGQMTLPSTSNQSSFLSVLRTSTNGVDIFERDSNTNPRLEVESGVYRGNGNGSFVSTSSTGNWNIVGLLNNSSTDHRIYVDGNQEDTDATSITIPASTTYNAFSDFTGEVAEIVYYEDMLSDTERRQVETYLAIKYGITLNITSQDYLNGAGSTILNRTNFTSYSNNIAGIGQANADSGNDAQGLQQTQSRSVNSSAIVEVSNASDLGDGEYLIWGSNNTTAPGSLSESVPAVPISGVSMTLDRKWRVTETGETGTVTISFDLSSVTSVSGREQAKFTLVLDDTENMSSPIATLKPSSITSDVVTFTNVDLDEGYFMVLGTDANAAPGNVSSGIALWFKAGAGVTPSSGNVTSWVDQASGLNLDSQNSDPAVSSEAMNFNDAIAFDGNDNIYNSGTYDTENLLSGGVLTGQHTFYVVAEHSSSNPGSRNVFFSNGSDQFRQGLHTNPRVHIRESSSANTNITPGSLTANQPNIYTIKRVTNNSATGGTLYINGTNDNTYRTDNGVTDEIKIVIGGENENNGSNSWNGTIAEIIAYATNEDDTDRQKIETYLAVKYGITLSNNYIATDGTTTIYNVSTYPNDIAGIGRDDSELLIQNKSLSENSDAIITMSSPSDLGDSEYLIWGNDNGSVSETTTGVPSGVNDMLARKWKVEETGDVGTVTVAIDVTGIAGVGASASDYALIIDGDGTFNDGDEVLISADDFTSNIVTFNSVEFSDGNIFSLATGVSAALTEISTTVGDYEVTSSCPVLSGSSYIALRDASNRMVAEVNPNGNNLGATCWGVRIRTSGDSDVLTNEFGDYFLDRNFYITPTTQPTSSVSVRVYVLNNEISDIRTKLSTDGHASGNDVSEYLQDFLRITKTSGSDLAPGTGGGGATLLNPTATAYGASGYQLDFNVSSFSEFHPGTDSGDPNQVLPITLVDFNASGDLEKVTISWSTAAEKDNDYFTIQRSRDGVDFEDVMMVDGAGDSNEFLEYEAFDWSPMSGVSYYRLKQTDYDSKFSYSDVVRVEFDMDRDSWSFYPNPTHGTINISFDHWSFGDESLIQVTDLTGRVYRRIMNTEDSAIIDISELPAGVYLISVNSAGTHTTKRVMKR